MQSVKYSPRELADSNWNDADQVWAHANKTLNNIIFVASTGAFVLSVNFIIGTKEELEATEVLIVSWAFLALSIILNILLQLLHMKWGEKIKQELNKIINTEKMLDPDFDINNEPAIKKVYKDQSQVLTATISFLIGGVLALFFFSVFNL